MICPPRSPAPLIDNWVERHRHVASFILHMIGIPMTVFGIVLIPVYIYAWSQPVFLLALVCFVGGYLVQFLGHACEGTDPGELILLKRKLGLPYIEFAPSRVSRRKPA